MGLKVPSPALSRNNKERNLGQPDPSRINHMALLHSLKQPEYFSPLNWSVLLPELEELLGHVGVHRHGHHILSGNTLDFPKFK